MTHDSTPTRAEARAKFRRTLIQVLLVQALAIAVLAALQLRYGL